MAADKTATAWMALKVAESNMDEDTKQELMDILDDYDKQADQLSAYIKKYEHYDRPIRRFEDFYVCPECSKRVHPKHTNCHWCGKLMNRRWKEDPDDGERQAMDGSGKTVPGRQLGNDGRSRYRKEARQT